MDSIVLNMKELLSVSESKLPKGKVVIPLYQRPYKWEDSKIVGLLHDIYESKKFLGILILDECQSHYDLIDGQQRITTCILFLAELYNKLEHKGFAQKRIREVLFSNNNIRVKNDSVAKGDTSQNASFPGENDYLAIIDNKIVLNISDDNDCYLQKGSFENAMSVIRQKINAYSEDQLSELSKRILECTVLVIIKKKEGDTVSQSAEQIFLDINEKAQKLEPADIFKGHCFKNYDAEEYVQLKSQWSKLLKNAVSLKPVFADDLSWFIYHFLIGIWNDESTLLVTKDLTINDIHVLAGKDIDYTNNLLQSMISFADTILTFWANLKNEDYVFEGLCKASEIAAHRQEIKKLASMRNQSLEILDSIGTATYQKFPFLSFVFYVQHNEGTLGERISFDDLRVIISDLYIYSMLFVLNAEKKSKSIIDTTVRHAINAEDFSVHNLLEATKELRRNQQDKGFSLKECGKDFNKQAFVYSIIDFYDSRAKILVQKYRRHDVEDHNQEHFIIPDNNKIIWKLSNIPKKKKDGSLLFDNATGEPKTQKREIKLSPISAEMVRYKKHLINYIIIPKELNGELRSFDIVHKISEIEKWYQVPGRSLPKHIQIFIERIKAMPSYQELNELKQSQEHDLTDTRDEEVIRQIQEKYDLFLSQYFSEENELQIVDALQEVYNSRLPIRQQATV